MLSAPSGRRVQGFIQGGEGTVGYIAFADEGAARFAQALAESEVCQERLDSVGERGGVVPHEEVLVGRDLEALNGLRSGDNGQAAGERVEYLQLRAAAAVGGLDGDAGAAV